MWIVATTIWTWSGHRQDDDEDDEENSGDDVDDEYEEDSDNIKHECDNVKQCG